MLELTPCTALLEQRGRVEISLKGLHWDELDEDISVAGLLAGIGDVSQQTPMAA